MSSYTPLQLAEAFIHAGEMQDALAALDDHLIAQPDDHATRRLRAQVRLRVGTSAQLNAALADLNALPANPADGLTRSVILERLNRPADALAAARTALEAATDEQIRSRVLERLLGLMRSQGQLQAALDLALEHDWVQWAADAAADLGDAAQAITYYTHALKRIEALRGQVPDNIVENIRARVLLKRAGAYQNLDDLTGASVDYALAHAIVPDDPMIRFNQGLIAHLRGTDATAELQAALDAAPPALRALMHQEIASDDRYITLRPLLDDAKK